MSYGKMMAMTYGMNNQRENTHQKPYNPDFDKRYTEEEWSGEGNRQMRQIGYGNTDGMESRRRRDGNGRYMESNTVNMANYRHEKPDYKIGGTFEMEHGGKPQKLTMEKAREWVESMENEDDEKPEGEIFPMEKTKEMAKKIGYHCEGQKCIDFYAIVNAMYSDYCKVAEKFDVDEPEFYACMAKAFLEDQDAVKNKAAAYYHHIAKK